MNWEFASGGKDWKSASFRNVRVNTETVYSGRREADVVMASTGNYVSTEGLAFEPLRSR